MPFDLMTMPNGLRVIGERIPHFRSASVGLWVGTGSQHETPSEAGLSHFLEHMVFKGTEKRTARQIAEEMDAVGGQLNAFTSKECTCFYAKTVDEHLPLAMDVVCDLAVHPSFDAKEMEKEKGVVLEEISMSEDTPEDLVHELLMLAYYGDQPIARPILGTEERISGYARQDLVNYWSARYRPQNAVFAIAGNYDWARVQELLEQHLGAWTQAGLREVDCITNPMRPTVITKEKEIEQVHICLGFPGLSIGDERSYELSLFNSVYGGAVSSRLFQTVREKHGLCYAVYSFTAGFLDCGMFGVSTAVGRDTERRALELILEELEKFRQDGVTQSELDRAREQITASVLLAEESTASHMNKLGYSELFLGGAVPAREILQRYDAVTREDILALAQRTLDFDRMSFSAVGRIRPAEDYRALLNRS